MLYTLTSNALTVSIDSRGAELQSVRSNVNGAEYLWQGDPAWWGSRAPVLFPFIGASKNGKHIYNGKEYAAPRHGFVRAAYFHLTERDDASVTLEYVDNPETRRNYPFRFTFQVKLTLEERKLIIANRVVNHSGGTMPFCLGAHEAYNCGNFTEYFLEFPSNNRENEPLDLQSETVVLSNGLLSGERHTVKTDGNILPLDYSLFENDTLIFNCVPVKKAVLKSKKNNTSIEVTYDAPNLAVWTKPGAPFLCIEPWHGTPGYNNGGLTVAERPGAVSLPPGGEFVSAHSIEITEG